MIKTQSPRAKFDIAMNCHKKFGIRHLPLRARFSLRAAVVLCVIFLSSQSAVAQVTFNNPTPIVGDGPGDVAPVQPYPSGITVSGLPGFVAKVTVTIHNLNVDSTPEDANILLVGPTGKSAILMSDAPGDEKHLISNLTLTFDDAASSHLPSDLTLRSGSYKPTNFHLWNDFFPAPAPVGPLGANLSVFGDTDPNGTWALYVVNNKYSHPWDYGSVWISGGWSLTVTASTQSSGVNPIDDPQFFVRQQYLDFLSREPDSGGFSYWLGRLQTCAAQPGCDIVKERKMVSAGFFYSNEFLLRKGYFIYRFYGSSLGRRPQYVEFTPDMASMGQSDAEEETKRIEFTNQWVNRPEFKAIYDGLSNTDFVNRLVDTAGVNLDRAALINALNAGESRAGIVRQVAESQPAFDKFFKEAFISMQYFGYLRRDPDSGGFDYWMGRLPASRQEIEANPDQYIYDMVGGFVYSTEYQLRFGARNY